MKQMYNELNRLRYIAHVYRNETVTHIISSVES